VKFKSIGGVSPAVPFHEALFRGLAPDGSLYVPETIPPLPPRFFEAHPSTSFPEVATAVIAGFASDIPETEISRIVRAAISFPVPLIQIEEGLYVLELFHGPTLAFKDIGVRFMAQTLSAFLAKEGGQLTILTATSGDTGGAVANGFHGIPNINVYLLYPAGRVSRIQEQQMTTLGGNIHAMEVDGTFDDCQKLIKETLLDPDVVLARRITTANSINIGRLLPQVAYYVWADLQLRMLFDRHNPMIVVPSGNLGNLTAALYAKNMGIAAEGFIAATNANRVLVDYLSTGSVVPATPVQTYSSAMDVGNPNNISRIQNIFGNNFEFLRSVLSAVSISDEETSDEIQRTFERSGYLLDPHTAVGIRAARIEKGKKGDTPFIVPATAHPAKFPEIVEQATGSPVTMPKELRAILSKPKQSLQIRPDYQDWKKIILRNRG